MHELSESESCLKVLLQFRNLGHAGMVLLTNYGYPRPCIPSIRLSLQDTRARCRRIDDFTLGTSGVSVPKKK